MHSHHSSRCVITLIEVITPPQDIRRLVAKAFSRHTMYWSITCLLAALALAPVIMTYPSTQYIPAIYSYVSWGVLQAHLHCHYFPTHNEMHVAVHCMHHPIPWLLRVLSYMHMMALCIYSLWRTRTWTICKPSIVFHDIWMVPKHCVCGCRPNTQSTMCHTACFIHERDMHVSSTGETCLGIWGYISSRVAVHKLQNTLEE